MSGAENMKNGAFLARLLYLFDSEYGTTGGFEGSRDLFLEAFAPPSIGSLMPTLGAFSRGESPWGALKAKYYSVGLTIQHFLEKYLSKTKRSHSYSGPVGFFVDACGDPKNPSKEIYILGDWVLFERTSYPTEFCFDTRTDIDKYIRNTFGHCLSSLMAFDETRLTGVELSKVLKGFKEEAYEYYKEAQEKSKGKLVRTIDVKSLSYALAGGNAILSHIVDSKSKVSLCGLPENDLATKKWVFLTEKSQVTGINPCDRCHNVATQIGAPIVDVVAKTRLAYYVGLAEYPDYAQHIAIDRFSPALCGTTARQVGIKASGWDYLQEARAGSFLCASCRETAKRAGMDVDEHPSLKIFGKEKGSEEILGWVQYPTGKILHLAPSLQAPAVCGVAGPVELWTPAFKLVSGVKLCEDCILKAVDKTLPFNDKIAPQQILDICTQEEYGTFGVPY